MRKNFLILFFVFVSFTESFARIGIFLTGGLGWGGGVYTAYEGAQINPLFKGPYLDTAYSHNYGFGLSYTDEFLGNFSIITSLTWDKKRFKVLYEVINPYDSDKDWTTYREYTFSSKFTVFSLGGRYYTGKDFLFEGKVFFGTGFYYGFSRGDMEIEIKDVEYNNSWYAKLMLFNILNICKRDAEGYFNYKGTDPGLKDDKGLFGEIGLVWGGGKDEGAYFSLYVRYSFSLTRAYNSINTSVPYHLHVKDYSPRVFLIIGEFGIFIN